MPGALFLYFKHSEFDGVNWQVSSIQNEGSSKLKQTQLSENYTAACPSVQLPDSTIQAILSAI
jgi:hypothetical protein